MPLAARRSPLAARDRASVDERSHSRTSDRIRRCNPPGARARLARGHEEVARAHMLWTTVRRRRLRGRAALPRSFDCVSTCCVALGWALSSHVRVDVAPRGSYRICVSPGARRCRTAHIYRNMPRRMNELTTRTALIIPPLSSTLTPVTPLTSRLHWLYPHRCRLPSYGK